MLILLVLLNVVLSIMNGVSGIEDQSLFGMWVSGFNAAAAFALFLMWFSECRQGR